MLRLTSVGPLVMTLWGFRANSKLIDYLLFRPLVQVMRRLSLPLLGAPLSCPPSGSQLWILISGVLFLLVLIWYIQWVFSPGSHYSSLQVLLSLLCWFLII